MTVAEQDTERESRELDAAERAHREAAQAWREIDDAQKRLERGAVLTTDGRREERITDPVERHLLEEELAKKKSAAAAVLKEARARLRAAQVNAANEELERLRPEHEKVAREMLKARARVENAYAQLCIACWAYSKARFAELRVARAIVSAARAGVATDDEREAIRQRSARSLLVRLTVEEGVAEHVDRPQGGLWGGPEDLSTRPAWNRLAELATARDAQAALRSLGPVMRETFERRIKR